MTWFSRAFSLVLGFGAMWALYGLGVWLGIWT